jgi:O-antigen ligase
MSGDKLRRIMQGVPLFLLLGWTSKAFTPDLNAKSGLMARDLEMRLEIVSSGAALWKQLLLPVFTIACLMWIIRSRNLLRAYMSVLFPVMLFGAFLLLSYFWSDHPSDTMRRAIRQVLLFSSVAGAVVIARSQNRFVGYLQVFSIFLLIYEAAFLLMPWISFDVFNKFTGLHTSKNEFGGIAGAFLLISVAVYRYYAETASERRTALLCGIGWGVLLILSGSKTPMGFVVLLAPLMLYSQHLLRYVSIGVIFLWLMIIVFIPMALIGLGEAPIDFYRSILPEEALTGRTGIWFHLLADMKKDWMFGTAYGAYWGVGSVPEALDIQYSYYQLLHTAHSGFVDLCMELGVIPTVFWLLMLLVFLIFTRNASDPMSSVIVAYALLHNCLETSFVHGLHFVWVIMVMAMMNILYSQAQKPNLDAVFRAIRERQRDDVESTGASPQTG